MREGTRRATTGQKRGSSRCNFVWLLLFPFFMLTFLSPASTQPPWGGNLPKPQVAFALHTVWDPDLTDDNPAILSGVPVMKFKKRFKFLIALVGLVLLPFLIGQQPLSDAQLRQIIADWFGYPADQLQFENLSFVEILF